LPGVSRKLPSDKWAPRKHQYHRPARPVQHVLNIPEHERKQRAITRDRTSMLPNSHLSCHALPRTGSREGPPTERVTPFLLLGEAARIRQALRRLNMIQMHKGLATRAARQTAHTGAATNARSTRLLAVNASNTLSMNVPSRPSKETSDERPRKVWAREASTSAFSATRRNAISYTSRSSPGVAGKRWADFTDLSSQGGAGMGTASARASATRAAKPGGGDERHHAITS